MLPPNHYTQHYMKSVLPVCVRGLVQQDTMRERQKTRECWCLIRAWQTARCMLEDANLPIL